jgi:carboxyl-terminal processing protease
MRRLGIVAVGLALVVGAVATACGGDGEHAPTAVPTLSPTQTISNSEYLQILEAVWSTVDQTYFDPEFGGLDWDEVHDRYRPLIAAAESDGEFYWIMNEMLFELNVSHLAVAPADQLAPGLSTEGSIGIDVRLLGDDAVITSVEPGSPGGEAGLQPGFVIASINGVSIEEIRSSAFLTPPFNSRNESLDIMHGMMGRLDGPPGTTVSVTYLDERGEAHEQRIVRAQRSGEVVSLGGGLPPFFIDFEATRLDANIGYIRFEAFIPPVDDKFTDAIESMGDAAGLIIDIRGNEGGVWPVRKLLAERLVNERVLFWTYRSRDDSRDVYLHPAETVYDGPVVVLIDRGSISSAEEFAGALQAIHGAVIVGERSPGRVLVGDLMELPNGATLIYPVEQTITADGTVLEGYGVIPDITVTLERGQLLEGTDAQLQAAIRYITETVR